LISLVKLALFIALESAYGFSLVVLILVSLFLYSSRAIHHFFHRTALYHHLSESIKSLGRLCVDAAKKAAGRKASMTCRLRSKRRTNETLAEKDEPSTNVPR
jgi:hypothetical protein